MIRIILGAMLWFGSLSFCYAEFFANVGDNSDAKEASAAAFEGIANVFLGLAKLEREGLGASGVEFDEALSKLSSSISQFKALAESTDFANAIDLSSVRADQLAYYMDFYKITPPSKAGDLFAATSSALARVYDSIKLFLEKRELSEYNSMQREISNVVGFGELASEIAKQNKL